PYLRTHEHNTVSGLGLKRPERRRRRWRLKFAAGLTRKAAPSACTRRVRYPRRSQSPPGKRSPRPVYGGVARRLKSGLVLRPQHALLLAVPLAVLLGGALVVLLLAPREAELELGAVVLPVERQRHERV